MRKGRTDQALADLNRAIKLEPNDASAYMGRARIWRRKKEYKRARTDYSEVIRLDPTDASPGVFDRVAGQTTETLTMP